MEEIKLKSNRKWIFITILPSAIIIFPFILLICIMLMVDFEQTYNLGIPFTLLFILIPVECIFIAILLVAKYKRGMSYVFDTNSIQVYSKDKLQYSINTKNIVTMRYYPFKWHYIITIYAGALNEGGAWKIHITDYQNKKYSLGYISYKSARELQKMYPKLEIM